MEQFYTVEFAAERLKLHPKTVLRLIHDGRLRATRIGKSYRILQSDLEAFGGAPHQRDDVVQAPRATCIVDCPDLSLETAQRLATMLNAAVAAGAARPDTIQLTTAYDPARRSLKIVVIAAPLDVSALLRTLSLVMEP